MAGLVPLDYVLAAVGVFIIYAFFTKKARLPLPPGPKRLPLVGNLLHMPSQKAWLTFSKWGDIWGDIVSVSVPGQTIIILNSVTAAVELLDQKSSIYSDRPNVPMAELTGWTRCLSLMPYGARFRSTRRRFHQYLGTYSYASNFFVVEEAETHRFLKAVLANPADLASHIRKTARATILRISHGYEVKEKDDPVIALLDKGMENFSQAVAPGAFLVNNIPQLKFVPEWFPGGEFKKTARVWRETLDEVLERPYAFVKDQVAVGKAPVSFASILLQKENLAEVDEEDLRWAALSLYTAGADTIVSAINALYSVLTLEPEVQKKAQAEIDAVIGNDRLPTIADRENLPYVNALVLELLRYHAVAPTGVPHCTTADDVHNGYFIPRGSIVIANSWRMSRDPRTYKDPNRFNPERFIPSIGCQVEKDPREFCFGFGRRICPGRLLADASVFIACAMTLAVFNVTKHQTPAEKHASHAQTTGIISHPASFHCLITPRSVGAVALIEA